MKWSAIFRRFDAESHAVFIDAPVVPAWLDHLDGTDAGEDRPRRFVAVANHQTMTRVVNVIPMIVDILGHLLLDRFLQSPMRSFAGDLFKGQANDRLS